jgi:phosphatidylserine/phosphatidylglycerophosphate/cardiolipin synthase-like enzyme
VTSAIAFISTPGAASSDKAPEDGNNVIPLAFATDDNYKLQAATLLMRPMATRFYLTVCIAGLILPVTTWAESGSQLEIHYAPRENLETVDIREIGRAELSIDMAAYVLSDPQIIEALTDAAERDVVIRLYLDKSQFAEHGPTRGGLVEALLAHPNVFARVKGEGVLMHLKAYAVDGEVLRTGSGNFSRSGLASQDNDLLLITDQAVVDAFEANFDRIWARAQNIGALDAAR